YPDRASDAPRVEQRREPAAAQTADLAEETRAPAKPHPAVVQARTKACESARSPDAIETRVALIDAAGALELLSLKPQILGDCASDNPTLRQHAEQALRLFGERERECKKF